MTRPDPYVARSIPEDYGFGPPVDLGDPVELWVNGHRCCGAPSLCGAPCMDDEDSQTGAGVVRRLDLAESRVAAVRRLVEERTRSEKTDRDRELGTIIAGMDGFPGDLAARIAQTRADSRAEMAQAVVRFLDGDGS